MATEPRGPLPLDGSVATRVRALMAAGRGRPSILAALREEGFDVTDNQLRTLVGHLRSERREDRERVREEAVTRAVEVLVPGVPGDLEALGEVRDAMLDGMRKSVQAADYATAAACAGRATAAAKARLDIVGATPDNAPPLLSEAQAAQIMQEEFGDTGALRAGGAPAAETPADVSPADAR